jgi:hypothetical protein
MLWQCILCVRVAKHFANVYTKMLKQFHMQQEGWSQRVSLLMGFVDPSFLCALVHINCWQLRDTIIQILITQGGRIEV